MAIEHFDEGVYAANYYSSHLDYRYPDQHLYAPPLFPAILEWTLIFTGGDPHSVMWVNVVLGTGLVAAIWWVTRLMAGVGAAFAAAGLATFSDFLIQYSRTALTETPVNLLMVLAVGAGLVAVRDRNGIAALAAALLTAAAWWTKYNGWLPLAILGAGLAGWVVFERPRLTEWLPRVGLYFAMACGAFLFWLPYLWSLAEVGGYSAVAKNHADYVVGLLGWWDAAVRHLKTQEGFGEPLLLTLIGGTFFASARLFKGEWTQTSSWLVPPLVVVTLVLPLGGMTLGFLVLAVYGIAGQLTATRGENQILGIWILMAWGIGLLVATPAYQPYPRLLMTLTISLMIGAGMGFNRLVNQGVSGFGNWQRLTRSKSFWRFIAIALTLIAITSTTKVSPLEDRRSFQSLAASLIKIMQQESLFGAIPNEEVDAIVYVIGEPGMYYHLASQSNDEFNFIAQPAANLGMLSPKPNAPRVPTYLVLGPHAPNERAILEQQSAQAKLINEIPYRPSDLVLLDDVPPQELEANREQSLQLWKIIRHDSAK